jgi:hypothetical protein
VCVAQTAGARAVAGVAGWGGAEALIQLRITPNGRPLSSGTGRSGCGMSQLVLYPNGGVRRSDSPQSGHPFVPHTGQPVSMSVERPICVSSA